MKLPSKAEWYKGIDIIMSVGAMVYLSLLSLLMGLAYINKEWTYTADRFTVIEIILIWIFISYFFIRMTIEVRSLYT